MMTAALRCRKIVTLCAEVSEFWKVKPSTGALAHLLNERRGAECDAVAMRGSFLVIRQRAQSQGGFS
jgi:hypothetical protein